MLGDTTGLLYSEIRWDLLATSHAQHQAHIDAEGFGTWVTVETGVKVRIMGLPAPGHTSEDFASLDTFGQGFDFDMKNDQEWTIVRALLKPGDSV